MAVAVGVDAIAVLSGVVLGFPGAVAAEVITVVGAALHQLSPLTAGQAVELVVAIALVELWVAVIEDAGQSGAP